MKEVEKAIKETAEELKLDSRDVKEAYNWYWKFFREYIGSKEFVNNLSEEEFSLLQASFNIPSIGKFCCTYDRYLRLKTRDRKLNHVEDN